MGLKTSIVSGVASVFAAIGDIKKSVTLRVTANAGYDPVTGTFAGSHTDYTFEVVQLQIKYGELPQNGVPSGTSKVIFEQRVCPVTPTTDDQLIIGAVWYEILVVQTDPAHATWTLLVREGSYEP